MMSLNSFDHQTKGQIDRITGKAAIVTGFYQGKNMSVLFETLRARIKDNQKDAAALIDMSTFLRTTGQQKQASVFEKAALDCNKSYAIKNGDGTGLRVLALVAPGDFMANTPIEFLLEGTNTTLILHYVTGDEIRLANLPQHDVAFVAIGESEENLSTLGRLEDMLAAWPGPVINRATRNIGRMTRDGISNLLANAPNILSPRTTRASRETLTLFAQGKSTESVVVGRLPFIIRPIGTHAGAGLEKITTCEELASYLSNHANAEFYTAPFIDYSGADGLFRKQRIVFIDGAAYASHMAVSEHWMVHYLNANMEGNAARRAEEASWMTTFETAFARRHAAAFETLHKLIGLDYFAIDCAELTDGRLLVFEADVAMIVHAMDSASLFPYKKIAMAKIFAAFEASLRAHAATNTALKQIA